MILDTLVNGEVKLSKSEKWIALSVLNNPAKVIKSIDYIFSAMKLVLAYLL